jgi:hypothetical protein
MVAGPGIPVYTCGDTVPGLKEQHKQAMQFMAYEKEKGGLGREPNWEEGGI